MPEVSSVPILSFIASFSDSRQNCTLIALISLTLSSLTLCQLSEGLLTYAPLWTLEWQVMCVSQTTPRKYLGSIAVIYVCSLLYIPCLYILCTSPTIPELTPLSFYRSCISKYNTPTYLPSQSIALSVLACSYGTSKLLNPCVKRQNPGPTDEFSIARDG